MPSSRSSRPRDQTSVSCIARRFFTHWATREAPFLSTISESTFTKATYVFTLEVKQDFLFSPVVFLQNHSVACKTLLASGSALYQVFPPVGGSYLVHVVVPNFLQGTHHHARNLRVAQVPPSLSWSRQSRALCSLSLFQIPMDSCFSPALPLLLWAHTLWQQLPNWPPTSNLFQLINPSSTFLATSSF